MNDLRVTPDGFIWINDHWVSFEKIQQAVLEAQNPNLHTIDTSGQKRLSIVNMHNRVRTNGQYTCNEEPLPLPTLNYDSNREKENPCHCHDDGTYLPLPTMNYN